LENKFSCTIPIIGYSYPKLNGSEKKYLILFFAHPLWCNLFCDLLKGNKEKILPGEIIGLLPAFAAKKETLTGQYIQGDAAGNELAADYMLSNRAFQTESLMICLLLIANRLTLFFF